MRIPQNESKRIIVDDIDAKRKLIEMARRDGRTLKETLKRVIDAEYKKEVNHES